MGNTISVMANFGSMNCAIRAMAATGSPNPIVPFTVPAAKKAKKAIISQVSIMISYIRVKGNL
jgi:hypothetical protein